MDLKQTIRARGMLQRDVARHLDVSPACLSKWVHGRVDIPSRYIRPLASLLHIDPSTLLPGAPADPTGPPTLSSLRAA